MLRLILYGLIIYFGYKAWKWLKANVRLDSDSQPEVDGRAHGPRKRIKVDQSQIEDVEYEEED